MSDDATRPRDYGTTRVEVQVLASMLAAAVLMTAIAALAVFIAGPQPPRLGLTGPTWQWTGSTGGATEPIAIEDPAAYTIDFSGDRTLQAVADCATVTGTYAVVPAGRAGGSTNSLSIELAPAAPPSCGAGSQSDVFVGQLATARSYAISGQQLTITLDPPGTMTFQAAPAAGPTPGA
jgi:hypothetical protein